MKHFFLFVGLCVLAVSLQAYPKRDVRGEMSENFFKSQARISLKLRKQLYSEEDSIPLQIRIKNEGPEVLKLYPNALDWEHTYRLVLKDSDNRKIGESDQDQLNPVQTRRNHVENLVGAGVKEIILHPGETFTREVNLEQRFQLEPGKKYFVTCYFYPNPSEAPDTFVRANNTPYFHLKRKSYESFRPSFPEAEETLAPEEVVYLFLGAEMKKNWPRYFKWIYFPEYIHDYETFSETFDRAEPEEKAAVLEGFKKYLTESNSGVIKYYKVTGKRRITDEEYQVRVFVERELNRIPVRFEYIFTLRNDETTPAGLWKIFHVIAKVRK